MVGNSLRSDVLPVVELGGFAVHVPYQITWGHEMVADDSVVDGNGYRRLGSVVELPPVLDELDGG